MTDWGGEGSFEEQVTGLEGKVVRLEKRLKAGEKLAVAIKPFTRVVDVLHCSPCGTHLDFRLAQQAWREWNNEMS